MTAMPVPARRHRGFSLIEVLAAFVILALVATALFNLFASSLNNVAAADEWSRALETAESHLEAAAAAQPLKDGSDRGESPDGRIRWMTTVAPYVPPGGDADLERATETLALRLFRISVEVVYVGGDGKSRTLALATVRLGPKNPT
ncbi:MAG: prepilin-type N-terminal cleavage/methylation domain-containing protein [Burkholderiales bacterium]|nr:prepilin-type N-terminal cleavage/methylation domain-containing protein [Burkholderiales bacterium]